MTKNFTIGFFYFQISNVQCLYKTFKVKVCGVFNNNIKNTDNSDALDLAKNIYTTTEKYPVPNSVGENQEGPILIQLLNTQFLFPRKCIFYCKDVLEMEHHLKGELYDLILLDPPWWNKYVRRKRAKTSHGYKMMYNDDLKRLPIGKLLKNDGLVVVWCTNSRQHCEMLQKEIFSEWNLKLIATWYWLKV